MKAQNIFCGKRTVGFCTMDPPTQHGAQWLPQHAPMGATSHATCKALPLPCAHHVAMTPAQPSSHWIGFCWGCCANHAHFLCFCDCANVLGCGDNCDILVWFGQRTGKTTGCTFPRCDWPRALVRPQARPATAAGCVLMCP